MQALIATLTLGVLTRTRPASIADLALEIPPASLA